MSSHVSGGWRAGGNLGGGTTWDELPCEWGEIREGGAKISPSLLMGEHGMSSHVPLNRGHGINSHAPLGEGQH